MQFTGVTHQCARLWARGATALVGISPFNSYFSTARIAAIVDFCARDGRAVAVFVPDDVTRFTLQARGYPAREAERKTRRQVQYLRNKIASAVGTRDVPIIGCAELVANPAYVTQHASIRHAFETDAAFRRKCLDTTRWVLSAGEDEPVTAEAALLGVQYLLAELPLFFHAPAVLGASHAVFVYHQCPDLVADVYRETTPLRITPGQGFGVLRFAAVEQSDADAEVLEMDCR